MTRRIDRRLAEERAVVLSERLRERGWLLGVAESCTGGLAMTCLTEAPGSSQSFAGGIVAYDDRVKRSLLGVDSQVLVKHGAVSQEVARAMARGIRGVLEVDAGVSITGIAGPSGAVPGKPVGTVWFGFALPGEMSEQRVRFPGDRTEVRVAAVEHLLGRLIRILGDD